MSNVADGDERFVEEKCVQLEANVGDLTEETSYFIAKECSEIGVLDIWTSQVMVRSGKPGFVVHVLCFKDKVKEVMDVLYRRTNANGVRRKTTVWTNFVRKKGGGGAGRGKEVRAKKKTEAVSLQKKDVHKAKTPVATTGAEKKVQKPNRQSEAKQQTPAQKKKGGTATQKKKGGTATQKKKNGTENVDKVKRPETSEEIFAELDRLALLEKQAERREQAKEHREEGNKWFKDDKFGMAIKCYTEAMEIDPDDPVNVTNRSNAFYTGRFYEESAADARKAIKLDETWAKGYYRLAMALRDGGDEVGAIETLDLGLQKVKKGKKTLMNLKREFDGKGTGSDEDIAVQATDVAGGKPFTPSSNPAFSGDVVEQIPAPAAALGTLPVPEANQAPPKKKLSRFKRERLARSGGNA